MDEHIIFLDWFINRMIYKHGYSKEDQSIITLQEIRQRLSTPQSIEINQTDLDSIIRKYYADFDFEKEDCWGFTDEERTRLRNTLLNITNDIIQHNT